MNILSALNKANHFLKLKGIISSKLDCEILISKVLKTERTNVILNMNKNLTTDELSYFNELVEQRSKKKTSSLFDRKKRILEISILCNKRCVNTKT